MQCFSIMRSAVWWICNAFSSCIYWLHAWDLHEARHFFFWTENSRLERILFIYSAKMSVILSHYILHAFRCNLFWFVPFLSLTNYSYLLYLQLIWRKGTQFLLPSTPGVDLVFHMIKLLLSLGMLKSKFKGFLRLLFGGSSFYTKIMMLQMYTYLCYSYPWFLWRKQIGVDLLNSKINISLRFWWKYHNININYNFFFWVIESALKES